MELSWRESAHRHIDKAFKEIKAAQPELSAEEVLKIVNRDHYPFGERHYHPYKMWRTAMKAYRRKVVAEANLPVTWGLWAE